MTAVILMMVAEATVHDNTVRVLGAPGAPSTVGRYWAPAA